MSMSSSQLTTADRDLADPRFQGDPEVKIDPGAFSALRATLADYLSILERTKALADEGLEMSAKVCTTASELSP